RRTFDEGAPTGFQSHRFLPTCFSRLLRVKDCACLAGLQLESRRSRSIPSDGTVGRPVPSARRHSQLALKEPSLHSEHKSATNNWQAGPGGTDEPNQVQVMASFDPPRDDVGPLHQPAEPGPCTSADTNSPERKHA